jgi:hypothetical protein
MTAGGGVDVAVSGMDVGKGAKVGFGVGAGAQAVTRKRNRRRKHTRFFILKSFPMLIAFYEIGNKMLVNSYRPTTCSEHNVIIKNEAGWQLFRV